jgi:3',5'-cyclic AMP phosphodiesterase CpdA
MQDEDLRLQNNGGKIMQPIQFIHITDTHLNAPGKESLFKKVNMADKLRSVFEHVRVTKKKPDFVLITGDLVHEGDKEDYEYFRKLVDEASEAIGAPVYVTLGNHDHRAPFREGYLGEEASEQAYFYSVTIDGLRLIALNSQVEGQHHGTIDEEQLAWLAEQLKQPSPNGTVVALHHPLLNVSIMSADHMLTNSEELSKALKTGEIVGIFAGHVHSNNVGTFDGMLSVAASGSAFGGEMADDGKFRLYDFCSYNIVTVAKRNATVQTVILPATDIEFLRYDPSIHLVEA